MSEQKSFDEIFATIRDKFNSIMKLNVTAEVARFDVRPYNVRILATVCLMLIHNVQPFKKGAKKYEPDINTLAKYDMKIPVDHEMFTPYIDYLVSGGARDKTVNVATERARFVATFVRYLVVLQQKRVTVVLS